MKRVKCLAAAPPVTRSTRSQILSVLAFVVVVLAPKASLATCGWLNDHFKFSFLVGDRCKLSITAWVCWDGKRVTYAKPVSIHPRCNVLAEIDGWHMAKSRSRSAWVPSKVHGSKWGHEYRVAAQFQIGECPVSIKWTGGHFELGTTLNPCNFTHFDEAKMVIYGNGAHPEGKLRIPDGYLNALRSPAPAATCGDGVENQPSEECDVDGCEVGEYCSSACTCQPVAPFPEKTFTRTPDGTIYRTAGHSPVQLFSCDLYGDKEDCPLPFWNAPQNFVDAVREVYPVPVNGTVVRRSDGSIFRMECGQPRQVENCADIGGCESLIDLDGVAVDRLLTGQSCVDGNSCTADVCEDAQVCRHPLKAECITPMFDLLGNE